MKLLTLAALVVVAVLVFVRPTDAQEIPEFHEYAQHSFLSAPVHHRRHPRVFYTVCNHSGNEHAFRWYGAGFGVTAFAQLEHNMCAYKNLYIAESEFETQPTSVTFQGGGSGDVVTWVIKNAYPWENIYSYVEALVKGPDGLVALSVLSINIKHEEDSLTITIASSGAFDDVILTLPEAAVAPGDIGNIVVPEGDNKGQVDFDTFGNILNTAVDLDQVAFLYGEVNGDTPSMWLHNDGEPIDLSMKMKPDAGALLGNSLMSFGVSNRVVVMRNDIRRPG